MLSNVDGIPCLFFYDFDGDNETYMRTTKLGDFRMLIFRCVFFIKTDIEVKSYTEANIMGTPNWKYFLKKY